MQRQADNRHHMIAQVGLFPACVKLILSSFQGLAFMSQYRKIRARDSDSTQEVEYNFGRLFHQIGQPLLLHGQGGRLTTLKACSRMLRGITKRR